MFRYNRRHTGLLLTSAATYCTIVLDWIIQLKNLIIFFSGYCPPAGGILVINNNSDLTRQRRIWNAAANIGRSYVRTAPSALYAAAVPYGYLSAWKSRWGLGCGWPGFYRGVSGASCGWWASFPPQGGTPALCALLAARTAAIWFRRNCAFTKRACDGAFTKLVGAWFSRARGSCIHLCVWVFHAGIGAYPARAGVGCRCPVGRLVRQIMRHADIRCRLRLIKCAIFCILFRENFFESLFKSAAANRYLLYNT